MKKIYALSVVLFPFSAYALNKDTPLFGGAYELSRGFASFFTPDEYFQNLIGSIFSPVFVIFAIGVILYVVYYFLKRYDNQVKSEIAQGQQLLLFKAKQMGLSDYQFKILKGMTDSLHLEKPSLIVADPRLFERSISRFMQFAERMGEKTESFEAICRDLIITYEKLYHHANIRKPITSFAECELNTLVAMCTGEGRHFIGKLKGFSRDRAALHVFANARKTEALVPGVDIKCLFWRAGDAEYEFSSIVMSLEAGIVEIQLPAELMRGQTVAHPLIDIVIPCTVTSKSSTGAASENVSADIFKLNESEAVIRCSGRLEHGRSYSIEFLLSDFAVRSEVQILRDRYISDRRVFYYNLKFVNLSEAGKTVIGNHLVSHLFS